MILLMPGDGRLQGQASIFHIFIHIFILLFDISAIVLVLVALEGTIAHIDILIID